MVLTTKKEIVILKPDQKKASLICSPNDSLDNKINDLREILERISEE